MRICIYAFIGSENLGDEAVFISIFKQLSDSGYSITVLSQDPSRTRRLVNSRTTVLRANNLFDMIRAIHSCDLFVCGGGGIIQDSTSILNTPRYTLPSILAKSMKKKVMYYGIGVGPLRYSFTRALTRLTMRFVDAVSVRDVASFDLLRSLGVRTPVHLASDPALSLSSVPVAETKILLKKMGVNVNKPYVVFCLRHWFDTYSLLPVSFVNGFNIQTAGNKRLQNNFASELARVVSYYQSQNCQVVFIPFWISRDNKVHDSVVDKLPSRKGVFVCRFELSPSQAIGVISSAEQLVGMRLHSLIFAAVAATPFVAIDYSPKVKNFLELLLGRYGVSRIAIKPEGLQSDELIGKIKRLPKELPVVTINKILELKARESKSLDVLKMVSL